MTDADEPLLTFTAVRCVACRGTILEWPGPLILTETITVAAAIDLARACAQHVYRCPGRQKETP